MDNNLAKCLTKRAQVAYASGSVAFTMLERLLLLYVPFYFLPSREYHLPNLIPEETFLGLATILGAALALGRIVDAAADPVVATISDNLRSSRGRRQPFLLLSALPLAALTVLIFYPPNLDGESLINGIWLALMMAMFYIAFTAYVNPYLSVLSEISHTNATRIKQIKLLHYRLSTVSGIMDYIIIKAFVVFA
ncbi:MAG: MFS transporter [Bacillota bacterium]